MSRGASLTLSASHPKWSNCKKQRAKSLGAAQASYQAQLKGDRGRGVRGTQS